MHKATALGLRVGAFVDVPVCRTRSSAVSYSRRPACEPQRHAGKHRCPHLLTDTCSSALLKSSPQHSRLQTYCQAAAATATKASPPLTTGLWRRLLPACKTLVAVLYIPLIMAACAHISQQWCLPALAGVLLPLQSKHVRHSMQHWQHVMQAAAAVEAETEDQPSEPEGEEPNVNTIIETGAELGNVQTPASVWLPYSVGSNGKVNTSYWLWSCNLPDPVAH